MAAQTGAHARRTETFHRRNCDYKARVQQVERIPERPCGGNEYDERIDEPGGKNS